MATGKGEGPVTAERVHAAWRTASPSMEEAVSTSAQPEALLAELVGGRTLREILEEQEKRVLTAVWERYRNIQHIFDLSGMARNTLRKKLAAHGIIKPRRNHRRG